MGVKITGSYDGNLRTRMVHEESGSILKTAAPTDNMGDGSAFSPTDLLVASLGSCVLTTIAIVAERDGISMEGCNFEGEKHMGQGPRRIVQIDLIVHLPTGLNETQQKRLENAAKSCPVKQSLSADMVMNMQLLFDVAG